MGDVKAAMEHGGEIDKKIDQLMEPGIQEIRKKYDEKNKAVDECDELFDRANDEINKFDKTLAEKMKKLDGIIAKLDEVNPIKNPANTGKFDPRFLSDIQAQIE